MTAGGGEEVAERKLDAIHHPKDTQKMKKWRRRKKKWRRRMKMQKNMKDELYSSINIDNSFKWETAKRNNVQEGDIIDIQELLFTQDRDYLINRYHHQVNFQNLEGKFLCIYFVPLSSCGEYKNVGDIIDLIDIYNELSNKGCFEVVLVATHDHHDDLDNSALSDAGKRMRFWSPNKRHKILLSGMPWLAIPYKDLNARKHADDIMGVSCNHKTTAAILDPTGKVLMICGIDFLKVYGGEVFPFTKERITELQSEDEADKTGKCSMKTLLYSSNRDFVISNDGKKVPICDLERKTVALFLYKDGPYCSQLAEKLKLVYERHKEDFEVVLIHLYFTDTADRASTLDQVTAQDGVSKNAFWKIFNSMPWLALPFKDPICRKLWRIFDALEPSQMDFTRPVPILIIIGPGGSYFGKHGADVLERCRSDAYPFTREKSAQIEDAKLTKLKLDTIIDAMQNKINKGKSELKCRKRSK